MKENPNSLIDSQKEQNEMPNIIKGLISKKAYEDLMIKQFINFNVQYIACECKQNYEVDPAEKLKKFYCRVCKKDKCIRCMKDFHKGSCGFEDLLNMLMPSNWPIDENGKRMKLRMCPYCGDVANKDESC